VATLSSYIPDHHTSRRTAQSCWQLAIIMLSVQSPCWQLVLVQLLICRTPDDVFVTRLLMKL
jgi:hypothetical protein